MFSTEFQMQLKAQKDAERKQKRDAEAAQHMSTFQGLDRQQSLLYDMKKANIADREKKLGAAKAMHSIRGVSSRDLDFRKQLQADKIKDQTIKLVARSNLTSFGLSPIRLSTEKKMPFSEHLELGSLLEDETEKEDRVLLPHMRRNSSYGDYQAIKEEKIKKQKSGKKVKNSTKKNKSGKVKEFKPDSPQKFKSKVEVKTSKALQTVDLDFSFGLITALEVIPDMVMIETAALFVVPDLLKGSMKECGIRSDCKIPRVENDVEEDAWFENEELTRWKVRGTVPAKFQVEKGKDPIEEAAPLQKILKRYSSYREVSEGEGKVKSWQRVREGRLALGIKF